MHATDGRAGRIYTYVWQVSGGRLASTGRGDGRTPDPGRDERGTNPAHPQQPARAGASAQPRRPACRQPGSTRLCWIRSVCFDLMLHIYPRSALCVPACPLAINRPDDTHADAALRTVRARRRSEWRSGLCRGLSSAPAVCVRTCSVRSRSY